MVILKVPGGRVLSQGENDMSRSVFFLGCEGEA